MIRLRRREGVVHGLLPFPVGQWPRPNNAAPSLQPHYRWARRYRFTAVFGSAAAGAYDDLFEVRNEIIVSVRSLISSHGHHLSGAD